MRDTPPACRHARQPSISMELLRSACSDRQKNAFDQLLNRTRETSCTLQLSGVRLELSCQSVRIYLGREAVDDSDVGIVQSPSRQI